MLVSSSKSTDRKYPIAPEGQHVGEIIAIKDLGIVSTSYGEKHKVRIDWRVCDVPPTEDGLECRTFQSFNLSWDVKSALRKNVKSVLGRDPGDEFDLDSLVGIKALLILGHDERGGRTFANIRAILPFRDDR